MNNLTLKQIRARYGWDVFSNQQFSKRIHNKTFCLLVLFKFTYLSHDCPVINSVLYKLLSEYRQKRFERISLHGTIWKDSNIRVILRIFDAIHNRSIANDCYFHSLNITLYLYQFFVQTEFRSLRNIFISNAH